MTHAAVPQRRLEHVLRSRLAQPATQLVVSEVVSIPDARHVRVNVNGVDVTVPRLVSYSPIVGDACYLLVQADRTVALGAVR